MRLSEIRFRKCPHLLYVPLGTTARTLLHHERGVELRYHRLEKHKVIMAAVQKVAKGSMSSNPPCCPGAVGLWRSRR